MLPKTKAELQETVDRQLEKIVKLEARVVELEEFIVGEAEACKDTHVAPVRRVDD